MFHHLFPFFRLGDRVIRLFIWTFALFQVLNAEPKIQVKRDLVYATKDKLDLKLDAYLPVGTKLRPSVLVIHGGGWMSGSKWQLGRYASGLARRGFNAFAINYRLAPKHKHPAPDRGLSGCHSAGSNKTAANTVATLTESVRWVIRREPTWHACLL